MLSSPSLRSSISNTSSFSSPVPAALTTCYCASPSPSSSISRIYYSSWLPFFSGFFVSTQPSSRSTSRLSALSSWNFLSSLILFSHGTPLVTKYYLSFGRFLFIRPSLPASHLVKCKKRENELTSRCCTCESSGHQPLRTPQGSKHLFGGIESPLGGHSSCQLAELHYCREYILLD